MTAKRRVTMAALVALALVGAMTGFIIARMQKAHAAGYAGFAYETNTVRNPLTRSYPGDIVLMYPDGPGERAGLRVGDRILTFNGIPVSDTAKLTELSSRVQRGDLVTYRIRRGASEREIAVRFGSPYASNYVAIYAAVNAFVAASFIAIGLLVLTRNPGDRRSSVFYAMMMAGTLSILSSALIALDSSALRGIYMSPIRGLLPIAIMLVMVAIFTPLTLHLALVFPRDRPVLSRYPSLIRLIYAVPLSAILLGVGFAAIASAAVLKADEVSARILIEVVIGAVAIGGLLGALRLAPRWREQGFLPAVFSMPLQSVAAVFGVLFGTFRIALALTWKVFAAIVAVGAVTLPILVLASFPILACVALYRSYRDAGVEERRQVKWPLWGTLIALAVKMFFALTIPILSIYFVVSGFDMKPWMRISQVAQLTAILAYLLIPISFAAAILKYRLMNIDVIIKKTVVYAILSGFIIVVYLGLVGGLGTVLVNIAGVKNQTVVIASTLLVALAFVPLRNRLQNLVERNLFRQKVDYPQALRAIAADTLSAVDLNAFMNAAVEKLQQALQNRAAVILTRRGDELIATAKIGVADSILGNLRLSLATAKTFDRPLDPRRRPLPDADAAALQRVETALVVPIRSHGDVGGVIALASKLSDTEFDLEDIEFISSAADQIAIALDRIRVQHDEADFEQAKQMQQALIPNEIPQVAGLDVSGIWHPARAVGGDYYDLLKLSETQLAVCIGDVAGKGIPAALLMSALQAAVRASAGDDVSPRALCERVRRVVVPSLGTRFVTFFFATIDTQARRIRYCNAGHNPPVLARADGSTVRLSTGGPVFSRLFRTIPFEDGEVELQEGDRLVLFTDGVSEARDAAENDFGEARLEELVANHRTSSARDLTAAISDAVSSFAGGREDDDFTLVAVAVSGL
ncbi:MAG: SpoIIE family protein phosphatase [Thermoanaerobaculia bacterium]|nr:SpoIIE family protein phosphatase [Thermoanaerobaculia bacterium]